MKQATRTGIGGEVGHPRNISTASLWITGGEFAMLARDAQVEPVISASRGEIEIASARPQVEIGGYRAMFDLRPTDGGTERLIYGCTCATASNR